MLSGPTHSTVSALIPAPQLEQVFGVSWIKLVSADGPVSTDRPILLANIEPPGNGIERRIKATPIMQAMNGMPRR